MKLQEEYLRRPSNAYITITVFNRKEVTLRCLRRLYDLGIFHWSTVVLVDDGSTDGTAECVRKEFSVDDVVIIEGKSELWWGGGTRLGMKYAIEHGAETIFWLNDDCLVGAEVLERLHSYADENRCITSALSKTPTGHIYGGTRRTWKGLSPVDFSAGTVIPVDAINGNCVCIPGFILKEIGMVDADSFPHSRGDSDYGFRAAKAGFPSVVLTNVVCENEDNLSVAGSSWLFSDIGVLDLWKSFNTPKSAHYFPAYWKFCIRYWGGWGVFLYLSVYFKLIIYSVVKAIVPLPVLRRLFGHHSGSWGKQEFYNEGSVK